MKISLPITALLALMALPSCTSVEKSLADARKLAFGEPKIPVTKADPSRFLPEGTSVDKVVAKNSAQQPATRKASQRKASAKPVRLLAKNTKAPSKTRSTSFSKPKAKAKPQPKPEPIPPLELPPLPEHYANENEGFDGILPSLDGSDISTYVDVEGESPLLPAEPSIKVQSVEEATRGSE